MLEDRSYMREDGWRSRWSLVFILMVANVVIFALQEISRFYWGGFIDRYFTLSPEGLMRGYIWQLITFQFLHANLLHLVFNMIGIYFFGRVVEERLGQAAFAKVYLLSGVAGGLLQSALGFMAPQHFGIAVVGASAGVYGLIAAATVMEPDNVILISFILPVKAKFFLYFAAGISLFYIFVPNSPVAHGAHLGGLAFGWAFLRYGHIFQRMFSRRSGGSPARQRELIAMRLGKAGIWRKHSPAEDVPPEEFISREVDPILDKISAHGIQSLTPQERKILEAARSRMEKR